ncbi:MAG: type II toxin-antitoxin system HicB family antitoxin [Candidatus Aegiribacteria sp.]|nr:type II toxin-antitoxin system HicB family antitoxin [Candidatus Aegiribacteria sp.]
MTDYLKYEGYIGSVCFDLEEEILYGQIEFINDLVTYEGKSIRELSNRFKDAVSDYIETCKEVGKEPEKPFSGTFNIRIGSELHKNLALKSKLENTTINELVRSSIAAYLAEPQRTILTHIHYFETESIYAKKAWYGKKYELDDEVVPWINQMY